MSKPYSFIPFLETKEFDAIGERKSGKIYLRIEVLTPVHVSQDYYEMNESGVLYKEFYKIADKYAISGTSLKGCIRTISEAVSNSCMAGVNFKNVRSSMRSSKALNCGRQDKPCIICSIYGTMGRRSKIKISDFHLVEGNSDIIGIPQLRKPNIGSREYFNQNGIYIGYKIYSHGIESILEKGNVLCNFFLKGAIFEGDVIFEELVQDEINLLCYSLGLAGDFNHKIGYGKPAYFGSIKITIDEEKTKEANKYITYANIYKNSKQKDISKNIRLLEKEYSFKTAKTKSDWIDGVY